MGIFVQKNDTRFPIGGGTKQLEQRLSEIEQSRATRENYGLVMLSDSPGINKSDGLALPTSEKDAAKPGTMAYELELVKQKTNFTRHNVTVNPQYVESFWGDIFSINGMGFFFLDFYIKDCPEIAWNESITIGKSSLCPAANCSAVVAASTSISCAIGVRYESGDIWLAPQGNKGDFNIRCHLFQACFA